MKIREKNEFFETTNRSVYNKMYKRHFAGCSYCGWHKNENCTDKWYGGSITDKKIKIRYPSWKLVSKNRKQWMKKQNYRIEEHVRYNHYGDYYMTWIEIKFE